MKEGEGVSVITFKSQYGTGRVVLYDGGGGGGEEREGREGGPFFKAQQDNNQPSSHPAIQPSNPGNR